MHRGASTTCGSAAEGRVGHRERPADPVLGLAVLDTRGRAGGQLHRVLAEHATQAAAVELGEKLLLLHAEGDETVPVEVSRRLHEVAPDSRLVVVPGGHHRSIQHDGELQALSVRFLTERLKGM